MLVVAAGAAGTASPFGAAESNDCRPSPAVPGVTEGSSRPGTVAPSVGELRAVLLLVHPADAAPDASTAPPTEMLDAAADWFRAVSYGRLTYRVETVPRWLALPARSAEYLADPGRYLADAVAAADPLVDFSAIDVVYLAPSSRTPETATFALLNGFGVHADGRDVRFWVPFGAAFAAAFGLPEGLVHETGHLLGLPDLYIRNTASSFHRWDVMAARWPAELLAWHRWKLGWLDETQIVCLSRRGSRKVTLTPVERVGGTKAVFVERGNRVYAIEVRAREGYDRSLCDTGVLVYKVDETPFRRSPVRIYAAQSDRNPPARDCAGIWNAPYDVGRGEVRSLRLSGLHVEVLARRADGSRVVRVTAS